MKREQSIHHPKLLPSNTGVKLAYRPNIFNKKTFVSQTSKSMIYMFVIGLFTHTKQPVQAGNRMSSGLHSKSFYCLVPAFFRMEMLNCSSATSTIVS